MAGVRVPALPPWRRALVGLGALTTTLAALAAPGDDARGDPRQGLVKVALATGNPVAATSQRTLEQDIARVLAHPSSEPERQLVLSLVQVHKGRITQALREIDALLQKTPNFRLAHLVRGDLLMAQAGRMEKFGGEGAAWSGERLQDLHAEARVRLAHYMRPPPHQGELPRTIMQLRPDQRYALAVDTSESRVYLFRNDGGEPLYIGDFYVSLGRNGVDKTTEGDERTPLGVYQVIGNLPRQKLAPLYGIGAFPLSYPNEWDRISGREGHGIWLHGTPADTYSRPPRSSSGCVVFSNDDLTRLTPYLQVGVTPVVISPHLEWVSQAQWREGRQVALDTLERWRQDIETGDANRWLRHYAPSFASENRDLAAGPAEARVGDKAVKVTVNNVAAFHYPANDDMLMLAFDQEVRDGDTVQQSRRRQYWLRTNKEWKIIYEGNA